MSSTALLPLAAQAADADNQGPIETVVVTGTRFNVDAAPAKSSLTTTQPQTIIHKSYIEDSVAATADYVNVLAIVPSLTGLSVNGPGLSDGNVKNTLRGLPDGDFGLAYDGIPFGDTNGPTHHSESYFPGSTIGSAEVDRGPGNAGTIGASTYGGTVKLYSELLTDDFHVRQTGTGGSWNTFNFNTNVQTGDFDTFGLTSRALINYQVSGSSGYLTNQTTHHENELLKTETEIAPNWTLTLFGSRNGLSQLVNDNNGATPAQIVAFGKPFALQRTDTRLGTFVGYNPEHKETDMDYLRLHGDISDFFHVDDQFYTYAYINKTTTATSVVQNQANILAAAGLGPGPITQGLGTKVGGVSFPNDIPGYTKLNAYRVWGNVLRTAWDYDFGVVSGELRVGVWSEWSATERQRFYIDVTQCAAATASNYCNGFAVEHSNVFADTSSKSAQPASYMGYTGLGYFEHTGWSQYEPFAELDIKPMENLTITPGIKYVWWEHTIDPNSLIKGKTSATPPGPAIYGTGLPPGVAGPIVNPSSFTTTRFLPFATVNYRYQPNWSFYFQYANGIYVPDITSFEAAGVIAAFPKPQTTVNYQFGSVFYADNFTADADIYYIGSNNTIQQITGTLATPGCPVGDTCNINAGTVTYKGIEGEATYAFDDTQLGGIFDGLSIFANGSLNSAKAHTDPLNPASPTYQDKQAPFWTAASGLIFKSGPWKLSLIDKVIGQQYEDSPAKRFDMFGSTPTSLVLNRTSWAGSFYKLGAYNKMDFTGYYDFEVAGTDVEFGGGIYNLLNDRSPVAITINDSPAKVVAPNNPPANAFGGAVSAQALAQRGASLDQYYFQPERSFQVTLKVHL
ncbi:MAG: TonB-dependent receptor [Alphaproteobacteria bacterium]|nr:TonB-dependent receptor [Alphaproteobacteria bacterium]